MHRHRLSVLAFASVLMLGGAACSSSSGGDAATATTVATTAVVTTTTAAATTVAPTEPATTAAPTTLPPTTAAATTTATAPAATTPEAAAKGLYAAWKAGDKAAAAAFANQTAIDTLFARTYTGPDLQFIACEPDGDVFACSWYYEGGSETYRTQGNATAGYQVIAITELAD